jgi:pyrroline-5-carboxylate reductase
MAGSCSKNNIFVSAKHVEKAQAFAKEYGVVALGTNKEVAAKAQYIFLAVKPAYVKEVLAEIKDNFTEKTVVISMAAGVTLQTLHNACGDTALSNSAKSVPHFIRIMPNLPAFGCLHIHACGRNLKRRLGFLPLHDVPYYIRYEQNQQK